MRADILQVITIYRYLIHSCAQQFDLVISAVNWFKRVLKSALRFIIIIYFCADIL